MPVNIGFEEEEEKKSILMKIEFDEYEEKLNLVTITETTTAPPIQSLHRNHQFNSLMHFSTNDQYNRRSSNSISSSKLDSFGFLMIG